MSLGVIIMAVGLGLVAWPLLTTDVTSAPWQFTVGLFTVGTGIGLIMGPTFSVTLNGVDPRHAGSASGTLSAIQQVGGAIGIAAIGVLFFGQLSSHARASFTAVEPTIKTRLAAAHVLAQAQATIIDGARACFVNRNNQKDFSETPANCKKTRIPARPIRSGGNCDNDHK